MICTIKHGSHRWTISKWSFLTTKEKNKGKASNQRKKKKFPKVHLKHVKPVRRGRRRRKTSKAKNCSPSPSWTASALQGELCPSLAEKLHSGGGRRGVGETGWGEDQACVESGGCSSFCRHIPNALWSWAAWHESPQLCSHSEKHLLFHLIFFFLGMLTP